MGLTFERVSTAEASAFVAFLLGSDWPFHGAAQLSVAEAEAIGITNTETRSFWIRDAGTVVGLVRLLDLGDVEDGSPLFDLRIASGHRGQGYGTAAVQWLSDHLFVALVLYPWVLSGCCAGGERRAESAEVEHGESDECFG